MYLLNTGAKQSQIAKKTPVLYGLTTYVRLLHSEFNQNIFGINQGVAFFVHSLDDIYIMINSAAIKLFVLECEVHSTRWLHGIFGSYVLFWMQKDRNYQSIKLCINLFIPNAICSTSSSLSLSIVARFWSECCLTR